VNSPSAMRLQGSSIFVALHFHRFRSHQQRISLPSSLFPYFLVFSEQHAVLPPENTEIYDLRKLRSGCDCPLTAFERNPVNRSVVSSRRSLSILNQPQGVLNR
jgi:hypothetical protein